MANVKNDNTQPMVAARVIGRDGDHAEYQLIEKTFSSGSKGFWGQTKIVWNGKAYAVQTQAVEIGSKK